MVKTTLLVHVFEWTFIQVHIYVYQKETDRWI